jgi:chemotaxis protein histidine kinase CheA
MISDDLTRDVTESTEADKTTQPTVTAIFRLVQRIDGRLDAMDRRFDAIEQRLDAIEQRLDAMDRRFDAIDKRFVEMSEHLKNEFLRFSDKLCDKIDHNRLHSEADYEDLLRRIRRLESRAT